MGSDDTQHYIDSIKALDLAHGPRDCIANHMNIANCCRPERTEEAADYVKSHVPAEIRMARVALRRKEDGLAMWTVDLAGVSPVE